MKVIEWKPIKGFEGIYEVSNDGRVRSLDKKVNVSNQYGAKAKRIIKGRELKQTFNGMYYVVGLSNYNKTKQYFVHRLVAEAFIDNPNNYNCVNHIDCNKLNNNVNNLEWCTKEYNTSVAWKDGQIKMPKGKNNKMYGKYGKDANKSKPTTKEIEALGYACGEIQKCFTNGWKKSLKNESLIEEDKKIKELEKYYDDDLEEYILETYINGVNYKEIFKSKYDEMMINKINEIIDKINEDK